MGPAGSASSAPAARSHRKASASGRILAGISGLCCCETLTCQLSGVGSESILGLGATDTGQVDGRGGGRTHVAPSALPTPGTRGYVPPLTASPLGSAFLG